VEISDWVDFLNFYNLESPTQTKEKEKESMFVWSLLDGNQEIKHYFHNLEVPIPPMPSI
jgi:hypothetical protein